MATLKVTYDKQEDIPEGFADLYRERNDKWELKPDAIEGIKTQADVDRVNEALRKEKGEHKVAKEKLAKFGEIDPETLPATLEEAAENKARIDTLTKEGKIDETKVQERIDAGIARALGPVQREKTQLQRELDNTKKTLGEKDGEIGSLKSERVKNKIEGSLRDAAIGAKVLPTAIDDAVQISSNLFEITEDGRIVTKDNVGVTPGIEPKDYFKDAQEKKPHWWPASQGGGAQGGRGGGQGAPNPWAAGNWNITAQGAYVKQHGEAKAAEAAKAAGVTLGATKPAAKAA